MAYDKQKAHEYYINYTKKGLLKGRKKGKKKKTSGKKGRKKSTAAKTQSLLGVTAYGLNDAGRIQAGLVKEKMKAEMNAALKSAGSDAEKEKIRVEYSQKAQQQIAALKNDPQYAAAKKTSSGKSSSKSGSSKSSGENKSSSSKKNKASKRKKAIQKLQKTIKNLESMLKTLPEEQKQAVRETIQSALDKIQGLKQNKSTSSSSTTVSTRRIGKVSK